MLQQVTHNRMKGTPCFSAAIQSQLIFLIMSSLIQIAVYYEQSNVAAFACMQSGSVWVRLIIQILFNNEQMILSQITHICC